METVGRFLLLWPGVGAGRCFEGAHCGVEVVFFVLVLFAGHNESACRVLTVGRQNEIITQKRLYSQIIGAQSIVLLCEIL